MKRRRFIVKAGGALAAAGTEAVVEAPSVIAQPKVQWRMSTAWARSLDVQRIAEQFAKVVEEISGGRFRIDVRAGGEIMPPFDQKEPAIQWFHTIPFGMNAEGMTAWLYQGDGLKLMEETYAAFNLVPRPSAAQAPQMAGWFRKKITTIGDYKGIKIRIGPLGGKVYTKAGASVVLTPAAEIYAALERSVIDACEWVGPHDDMQLGLHNTARYYYYPGWHEPGSTNEFGFNKKAYDTLPVDLRWTLDHATAAMEVIGLTTFHAKNAMALERLKTEFKGKVEVLQTPAPVLRDLKESAAEVINEESEKTPMAREVHVSFTKFQALVSPWDHVAEGAYHQLAAG